MSGLEVLAVVAAASQFCAHLLKITESLTELHEHIKHGPDRIRSYSKQLESLSCTIEFIQRNQKFHIDIVENLVKAISDKVDTLNRIIHTSFSDVRRRSARKYFRIPKERITERRIKESLAALVDDKINLIICITMATDVTMKDASDQRSIDMDVDMDKASLGKSEALEQPVSCADSQIVPYMGDSESPNSSTDTLPGVPTRLPSTNETRPPMGDLHSSINMIGLEYINDDFAILGNEAKQGYFAKIKVTGAKLAMIGGAHKDCGGSFIENVVRDSHVATCGPVNLDVIEHYQKLFPSPTPSRSTNNYSG